LGDEENIRGRENRPIKEPLVERRREASSEKVRPEYYEESLRRGKGRGIQKGKARKCNLGPELNPGPPGKKEKKSGVQDTNLFSYRGKSAPKPIRQREHHYCI